MLTVLIPMAGRGKRFSEAGFDLPKPLIPVHGVPMIEVAVKTLGFSCRHVFVVSDQHIKTHPELLSVIDGLPIEKEVLISNKVLRGPATSCLEAEKIIDSSSSVVIANCDQIMEWNEVEFLSHLRGDCDGVLHVCNSEDPKNSFVRLRDENVVEVAEKRKISNIATTGIYAWKRFGDFVLSANAMISAKASVNGEYYVAPAYNEAIKRGKTIRTSFSGICHLVGTPLDLDRYLTNTAPQETLRCVP